MRKLLTSLLLLFALTVSAQETPQFLLERIDVRGLKHASPEIVINESRLTAGQTYSEAALAEANDRINRLPFVLNADFSLEKGSVRDSYVLVVTVDETRRFFYHLDAIPTLEREDVIDSEYDTEAWVGYRWFLGRRGVLHIAQGNSLKEDTPYTSRLDGIEAGYTHHGLFGTNAFATANLRYLLNNDSIEPELVVGVPLTSTQTLTTTFSTFTTRREVLDTLDPDAEETVRGQRLLTVRWSHNTTNHPFFPTRGTLLSVTPIAAWTDESYYLFTFPPLQDPPRVVRHTRSLGLEAAVAKYYELSDYNSLALSVDGGYARIRSRGTDPDPRDDIRYGQAQIAFSHSFRDPQVRDREGDKRVEFGLRGFTSADYRYLRTRTDGMSAHVAFVYRNAWGSMRIGLGYAW